MIFVYDTETSGLPLDDKPLINEHQPHLIQLATLLLTHEGEEMASASLLVQPKGLKFMDAKAEAAHGISMDELERCGVPLATVLSVWANMRSKSSVVVGHNVTFDNKIMAIAFERMGRQPTHPGPSETFDTMVEAGKIMKLPPTDRMRAAGFDKFKPPNLTEAYRFFFNEELKNAHDALADARGSARLYFHLQRMAKG